MAGVTSSRMDGLAHGCEPALPNSYQAAAALNGDSRTAALVRNGIAGAQRLARLCGAWAPTYQPSFAKCVRTSRTTGPKPGGR